MQLLESLVVRVSELCWLELQSTLGPAVEGQQSTGNPRGKEDLRHQDNSRTCQRRGLPVPPGREAHPEKADGIRHWPQHWTVQDDSER